jgi:hypothetical protein
MRLISITNIVTTDLYELIKYEVLVNSFFIVVVYSGIAKEEC